MTDSTTNSNDRLTTPSDWPGATGAFSLVKPFVKSRIWDFISLYGLYIISIIVIEILVNVIVRRVVPSVIINDLFNFFLAGFTWSAVISLYYACFDAQERKPLGDLIKDCSKYLLRMAGLLIVMDVVLAVSLLVLIIPFFFVLPRVYLAPYFLIANDSTVGDALSDSWNLTKGNCKKVYGLLGLDIAIALLVITIISIPFAIYWGTINTGSFALLSRHLAKLSKSPVAPTNAESAVN